MTSLDDRIDWPIFLANEDNALGWYLDNSQAEYIGATNWAEQESLTRYLASLRDGTVLPVRGRDFLTASMIREREQRKQQELIVDGDGEPTQPTEEDTYTAWDYGVAFIYTQEKKPDLKLLFFLWENGTTESFRVDGVNFIELVHFVNRNSTTLSSYSSSTTSNNFFTSSSSPSTSSSLPLPQPSRTVLTQSALDRIDPTQVVVINHGWSPLVGPNYPLIRTLEFIAQSLGWRAVVPDFVPSYRMGHRRDRSHRIAMIYEGLLCLRPRPTNVVLVGHSQGGAASALACTDRVVDACHVSGLLLVGSESPCSLDGMGWAPKAKHVAVVHAAQDSVISIGELEDVARHWGCPFHALESTIQYRSELYQGDDVAHDFLARDLLLPLIEIFEGFLDRCAQDPASASLKTEKRVRRRKKLMKKRRAAPTHEFSSNAQQH